MAAQRMTVHLRQETLDALHLGDTGISTRLNEVVLRYRAIVEESRPDFTHAQWCALCDALNGCWLLNDAGMDPVAHLWMDVADAPALGIKWEIDQAELVKRLQEARYAELVAVQEVVRRFWQNADKTTNEALALALKV